MGGALAAAALRGGLRAGRSSFKGVDMAGNIFTNHIKEVGESYGEHFGHASRFGLRMIGGGIACLIHAVLPFAFATRGSETVKNLHKNMAKRVDKPNWERHPII